MPRSRRLPDQPHHPHLTPPPKPRAFQMAKLVENENVKIEMPRHYNKAFRKVCIFKRLSGDRLEIDWKLSGD